ncbi:MAG: type II toxin-antitoxin system HicA family toxin [Candidatus Desantisbacteria bacterium]
MPRITPIPAGRLCKLFEKAGFKCVRREGDHSVYTKHGVLRPVVIPDWSEVPVFIIKNNLRTANIGREEYFTMLKEV